MEKWNSAAIYHCHYQPSTSTQTLDIQDTSLYLIPTALAINQALPQTNTSTGAPTDNPFADLHLYQASLQLLHPIAFATVPYEAYEGSSFRVRWASQGHTSHELGSRDSTSTHIIQFLISYFTQTSSLAQGIHQTAVLGHLSSTSSEVRAVDNVPNSDLPRQYFILTAHRQHSVSRPALATGELSKALELVVYPLVSAPVAAQLTWQLAQCGLELPHSPLSSESTATETLDAVYHEFINYLTKYDRHTTQSSCTAPKGRGMSPQPSPLDVNERLSSSSTLVVKGDRNYETLTNRQPHDHLHRSHSLKDLLTHRRRSRVTRQSTTDLRKLSLAVASGQSTPKSRPTSTRASPQTTARVLNASSPSILPCTTSPMSVKLDAVVAGDGHTGQTGYSLSAASQTPRAPSKASHPSAVSPPTRLDNGSPHNSINDLEARNKVTLKKVIFKGLARMGITRQHPDFKDYWNQVYKSCQFSLRKELPASVLSPLEVLAVVEKHLELYTV
ncbi:hypothetical protein IWQ62_001400 [Dispira parvispora]|uniref:Sld7 C-terminal domain-containing protein n=1 Tax=Dispira parvispora TaxID=1520584 RepID=A0A9W8AV47_9FUNG|nr:hypothetical protein IWQ62_001400 [Dispira parvispora]